MVKATRSRAGGRYGIVFVGFVCQATKMANSLDFAFMFAVRPRGEKAEKLGENILLKWPFCSLRTK